VATEKRNNYTDYCITTPLCFQVMDHDCDL